MKEKYCNQEVTHITHIWHDLVAPGVGQFFSCPGLVVPTHKSCDRSDDHSSHLWYTPYAFYQCAGVVESPTHITPQDIPQEAVDAYMRAYQAKRLSSQGVTFPGEGQVRAGLSAAITVMYRRGDFA